jgi:5'-3' exonuclease
VAQKGKYKVVKIADSLHVNLPAENILIVDAMNLAFRWKHNGSTAFVDEYIRTVKSLARSYKAGKIIITADMGGSRYRREIFPEYKANRKELYANDTEEQKEATRKFFDEYERVLAKCSEEFPLLRYDGVEADDIAAYIVSRRRDLGYERIWLISSDRDWDLLVDENVSRFSTVTRKEQTVDTWDNPVPREDYLSYKCLIGDKGDNIPGVAGVGPKRACQLISEYGSVFDIADAIPLSGKYKYIQSLNEFGADQLRTNVELMDLLTYCEEAIGKQNALDVITQLTGVPRI